MKNTLLAFCLAIFFIGCQNSTQALNTRVAPSYLPDKFVKEYKTRYNNNGLLEVEIVLRGDSKSQTVDYKVAWLDKDRFELTNSLSSRYERITIPKKQEVVVRKMATDKRAVNFRLDMQEVK